jgi:luciferase family oxidoreductase group 1
VIGIPVSVLDVGLTQSGGTSGEAIANMAQLAVRAEKLGFYRFWVAEHHGTAHFSSSVPPVLAASLAAATSTIRVGSGGVMLPNHSPLIVAEQFGTLGALSPGRIDLGFGRGPGSAGPGYAEVLRPGQQPASAEEYARQARVLLGYFGADGPGQVRVPVAEEYPPQLWVLVSSEASAGLAAELGLPVCVADHLAPANTDAAVHAYRRDFRPSRWLDRPYVMVSVAVICAESDERAGELARPLDVMLASSSPHELKWPTPAEAAEHQFTDGEKTALAKAVTGFARGGPETLRRRLTGLVERVSPDELLVTAMLYDLEDRVRSLELLTDHVITPAVPGRDSAIARYAGTARASA